MKKLKKLVSLLAAIAICVLLPGFNTLTVSADGPVTYYVKLGNDGEWRYQASATWDDKAASREPYYMQQDIRDGDIVIVDGAKAGSVLEVPVRLSNLTVIQNSSLVFHANAIDECYVLHDAKVAINGDVTNGYVYDNAVCTFNNNVNTLNILDDSGLHATVTVAGTVNHLIGKDTFQTYYDYYSFEAGKTEINDGRVKTDVKYYSTTAPAADSAQASQPAEQNAQTAQPADQNTQAAAQPKASAGEYDDVPKTGESNIIFLLLGVSVFCFAGRYYLKRA